MGFGILGFRGFGFRVLGFRVWGFRLHVFGVQGVEAFWGKGFRVYRDFRV